MKNRNLLLLVALLLTIFAVPSCDFVNVDSPEVGDGDFKAVYRVQGTVLTENTTAIEGAKVLVGDKVATTNAEGKFEITTENAFPSGTEMTVTAQGYVQSISTIQYSDQAPAMLDFFVTLSRALPAGFVNLSTGGELVFEDVTVTIPGNNSASLNGETLSTIQLSVSPLSPISTYGSFSGNSIKTLVFSPVGMVFEKPITVTMKIPAGFNADNLIVSLFNESTNTWENTTIAVSYNGADSEASFQMKAVGSVKLNNPESLVIFSNQDLVEAYENVYYLTTCDCENPFNFTGGEYVANYELVTTSGPAANYTELFQMGFFGSQNIWYHPWFIPNGWWPGVPVFNVFDNNPFAPISMGNCESKEITFQRKYRQITGKYTYNNEVKFFTFKFYYSITTPTVTDVPCTVHNGCHQGCGNE